MAYHDVLFPEDISYGSAGGPGFKTTVIQLDSGAEQRFARWSTPRRTYEAKYGVKTLDQLSTLLDFYVARAGPLHSFRYKDFLDFTTAADHRSAHTDDDVHIATGDGTTRQFQLLAQYTSPTGNALRTITKPKSGTVLVSLDATPLVSGAFSVDLATGIITCTSAPTAGTVIRAGCEYYTHVRFGEEVDEALMLSLEDFSTGGVAGGVPLVEVIDEVAQAEDFDYGGSSYHSMTADVQLSGLSGRVVVLNPTTSGLKALLPSGGTLEPGGPHFYLVNANDANSVSVRDGTVALFTLAAASTAVVLVYKVSGVQKYVGIVL